MDAHPLVDAVENVRIRIRRSGRALVRDVLGVQFAPVHAQPRRYREPIVDFVGMEELEVLVVADQLLERGAVNDVRFLELFLDRRPLPRPPACPPLACHQITSPRRRRAARSSATRCARARPRRHSQRQALPRSPTRANRCVGLDQHQRLLRSSPERIRSRPARTHSSRRTPPRTRSDALAIVSSALAPPRRGETPTHADNSSSIHNLRDDRQQTWPQSGRSSIRPVFHWFLSLLPSTLPHSTRKINKAAAKSPAVTQKRSAPLSHPGGRRFGSG